MLINILCIFYILCSSCSIIKVAEVTILEDPGFGSVKEYMDELKICNQAILLFDANSSCNFTERIDLTLTLTLEEKLEESRKETYVVNIPFCCVNPYEINQKVLSMILESPFFTISTTLVSKDGDPDLVLKSTISVIRGDTEFEVKFEIKKISFISSDLEGNIEDA